MDILKFLSETEFAAECKVSVETIRRATKRGDLPYVKLSDRKRLIPENALGIMLAEVLERRYAEKNSGHRDAIDIPTLPDEVLQPIRDGAPQIEWDRPGEW